MSTISPGLCQCGCGRVTRVALRTNPVRQTVKGEPCRYVLGHGFKGKRSRDHRPTHGRIVDSRGYVRVYMPEHPRAERGSGYVREHIIVAEKAFGGPLPTRAVVHHANGLPGDNRPENLVVCEDQAYHLLIHQRMKARDACGNPDWQLCWFCQTYDTPENLTQKTRKGKSGQLHRSSFHRKCKTDFEYERRHAKARAEGRTPRPRRRG